MLIYLFTFLVCFVEDVDTNSLTDKGKNALKHFEIHILWNHHQLPFGKSIYDYMYYILYLDLQV